MSTSRSTDAGTKRVSQPFGYVAGDACTKRVSQPGASPKRWVEIAPGRWSEVQQRVKLNVGTFNVGLAQASITAQSFPTKALPNLRRIVAKGFEEGDLHLLNLCEVGGHMQGLSACHIEAATVVDEALKKNEYGSEATQAYMSIWHKTGASQPGGLSLQASSAKVHTFASSMAVDPQLVLHSYVVTTHGEEAEGLLLVGQLHILEACRRGEIGKKSERHFDTFSPILFPKCPVDMSSRHCAILA